MRTVFADSSYWIALTNSKDQWHNLAVEVSSQLGACRILTSEMVLVEFLNHLCGKGKVLREAAVAMVDRMRGKINVTVLPQTQNLFVRAFDLYRNRPDKNYSLTDCSTMVLMAKKGVSEILSMDLHFEQHGLTILLKQ